MPSVSPASISPGADDPPAGCASGGFTDLKPVHNQSGSHRSVGRWEARGVNDEGRRAREHEFEATQQARLRQHVRGCGLDVRAARTHTRICGRDRRSIRGARGRSRGAARSAARLPVPRALPRGDDAAEQDDVRDPGAGRLRRNGRIRRPGKHDGARAQSRGSNQRRTPGRRGQSIRRDRLGRHDGGRRRPEPEAGGRIRHQRGNPHELRRRGHALGHMDHVRGDVDSQRRSARLLLRGDVGRPGERALKDTDHCDGALLARVDRRRSPHRDRLPDRGLLRRQHPSGPEHRGRQRPDHTLELPLPLPAERPQSAPGIASRRRHVAGACDRRRDAERRPLQPRPVVRRPLGQRQRRAGTCGCARQGRRSLHAARGLALRRRRLLVRRHAGRRGEARPDLSAHPRPRERGRRRHARARLRIDGRERARPARQPDHHAVGRHLARRGRRRREPDHRDHAGR